jgi:hypothetical protein
MIQPAEGTGFAIPADVIPRLTEIAGRMAAGSTDVRPAEAAAVVTTQATALELLFHTPRIPDSEHRQVYVITMTGRFLPHGHSPLGKVREGTVRTTVFDADTLVLLTRATGDQDHRALLPHLGQVSILSIPRPDQLAG